MDFQIKSKTLLHVYLALIIFTTTTSNTFAFGIYGASDLANGYRWDAAPQMMNGYERSLDGGLRYSVEGGSFTAYRDMFSWQTTPTVGAFQSAINNAFNAWTVVDSDTNLATDLYFVEDVATPVSKTKSGWVYYGAEIDLFADTSASSWNYGNTGQRGESSFYARDVPGGVTLTSGTTGYGGYAISGSDITMNSNTGALWTLVSFQTVLTHEIGHSLGLSDVDYQAGPDGDFIDDNYNSSYAQETLTNSFADLIDVYNPAASPLNTYYVANGNPGVDSPGVDILMESVIPDNLYTFNNPLRADDFAGRQFLYPFVAPQEPCLERAAYGDFSCDATVSLLDLDILGQNWNKTVEPYTDGDATGNGVVTLLDLDILGDNFGQTTPIPEPTTILLIGACSLGLLKRKA